MLPVNLCLSEGDLPGVSISFDGKRLSIPSPSRKRKTHIDSIDKWLSAFAVYCMILLANFPHRAVEMFSYQEIIRSAQRKFAEFAWLSYDIDFRRKAASNPTVNWGEWDIQLYLMKFTGQAKSSRTICGSGDQFAHGCSLSALRPTTSQRGTCHNFSHSAKCSQDPYPFSHQIMNLIRLLTLQTLQFTFTFTAKHVPGVDNGNADSLSRFQMSRFYMLAPDASPVPCPIPPFLTNVRLYKQPISSSTPLQPLLNVPISSGERQFIRFWLMHNLVSPKNPLLPTSESILIHFVTYLSKSVSYGTIKVDLAAVKNLHTEFGCSLELTSMSLLHKTLRGIKSCLGVSKRARYPITVSGLRSIYAKLKPFHSLDVNFSMLWASFTLAFLGFYVAANSPATANLISKLICLGPILLSNLLCIPPLLLKLSLKRLKDTISGRQPSSL